MWVCKNPGKCEDILQIPELFLLPCEYWDGGPMKLIFLQESHAGIGQSEEEPISQEMSHSPDQSEWSLRKTGQAWGWEEGRGGEPLPQAPDGSPVARTPTHLYKGCWSRVAERLRVTAGLPCIQDTDIARESEIGLLTLDRDALLPCILGSFLATAVLFCVPGTTLCYWAS